MRVEDPGGLQSMGLQHNLVIKGSKDDYYSPYCYHNPVK